MILADSHTVSLITVLIVVGIVAGLVIIFRGFR